MSIPYTETGRRQQKARTRDALTGATRELVAEGVTPTVEQAAARAGISRTTAYRYFPNQRSLLVAAHPEMETQSLLGDAPPEDTLARLDLAVDVFTRMTVETEPQQRAMLRLSLEPEPLRGDLPLRKGRAIGWLEEALAPLRDELGDEGLRRLVLAIRSASGIESLVWLTDVAGLSREEAVDIMRWTARALYESAVAGADTPRG